MRHIASCVVLLNALLPLSTVVFLSTSNIAFAQSAEVFPSQAPISQTEKQVEPRSSISLTTAIRLAFANNAELTAAKREIEAAEGSLIQSKARPNPELSFMQEDARSVTKSTSVQLNLPLELGGKRSARINASEYGRSMASADFDVFQAELRAKVIVAYFEVLGAQERLRLIDDTVLLAKRSTDNVSKRVLAGKISPVEESKARVTEANIKIEQLQAMSDLRSARQRLSTLWGNPTPQFERVEDSRGQFAVPSWQQLEQRLLKSPHMKRAEFDIQRKRSLVDLERAKRIPDPTISIGLKNTAGSNNQILLGLSVPIPLFDSNKGNLLEAMRREDKARDEFTAVQLRLQSEVMQTRERLLTLNAEVDILNGLMPDAESTYEAAIKGFDAGKFSFLEVLDAQRVLIQAKLQRLRTASETHRVAVDIDRLIGDVSITNPVIEQMQ